MSISRDGNTLEVEVASHSTAWSARSVLLRCFDDRIELRVRVEGAGALDGVRLLGGRASLLVPHAGDWRAAGLPRRAAELGSPVRAMLENFHPGSLPGQQSYLSDGGGQVMVTAVKGGEDGGDRPDLIVRAVENAGRPNRARIEVPMLGRVIAADFGPPKFVPSAYR